MANMPSSRTLARRHVPSIQEPACREVRESISPCVPRIIQPIQKNVSSSYHRILVSAAAESDVLWPGTQRRYEIGSGSIRPQTAVRELGALHGDTRPNEIGEVRGLGRAPNPRHQTLRRTRSIAPSREQLRGAGCEGRERAPTDRRTAHASMNARCAGTCVRAPGGLWKCARRATGRRLRRETRYRRAMNGRTAKSTGPLSFFTTWTLLSH
jgi:hypothetical protein